MANILNRIKLGANFAVFLLFFGVAALEAFESRSWLKAVFWLAIGVMFLAPDNHVRTPNNPKVS